MIRGEACPSLGREEPYAVVCSWFKEDVSLKSSSNELGNFDVKRCPVRGVPNYG